MTDNPLTPTQRAILEVLADGEPHPLRDLQQCLPDGLGSETNVHPHLTAIRRVLHPRGQDVICQYLRRQLLYRWVRLLNTKA